MGSTKITGTALKQLINSVGSEYTKDDLWKPINDLEKLFELYGQVIKKDLQANLKKQNKLAVGNLHNNIYTFPSTEGSKVTLNVGLEDYYVYVNDGRTGKRNKYTRDSNRLVGTPKSQAKVPPFEAITGWVRNKAIKELSYPGLGFKTRQTARVSGKVKKMRLVEKIRWGIYWNGIKPSYFYTDVINEELIKNIEADIYQLLGRTIELNVSNVNNSK